MHPPVSIPPDNSPQQEPSAPADPLRDSTRRIAHDLNNALGIIIGNLELVRMDLEPSHPAIESVMEIRKATAQARKLVGELLTNAGSTPPPAVSPSTPSLPASGRAQHILYLDDEEPLVFLTANLFKRLGYRVTGFTQAESALSAFEADPMQYDLVVTDFNLPQSTGLEVASRILAIRPLMPVILVSGEVSGTLVQQAQAVGVRHVIYKPGTVDDLCRAIHQIAGGL